MTVLPADTVEVLRVDRVARIGLAGDIALRSPRQQADGSWRYDAYLSHADRHLDYGGGRIEVATEAALSSKEYLDALVGLAIVDERDHRPDRPVDTSKGTKPLGVTLGARYDKAERAVVLDLVVHDPQANRDIREKRKAQLSEGYYPTYGQTRADGAVEQVARKTQHIGLVRAGRDDLADIRTDGGSMTPEQIAALAAEIKAALRTDAADQALAAEKQRADKAESDLAALRASLNLKADAKTVDLNAIVTERVQVDTALLARADALGVKLPATSTAETRLRDLAVACGADPLKVDNADYARGVVDAARPSAARRHTTTQRPAPASSTPIRQS